MSKTSKNKEMTRKAKKASALDPKNRFNQSRYELRNLIYAALFLALPHVAIPSIPFFLVILALLAYIIIVGPVNYFYLIRNVGIYLL